MRRRFAEVRWVWLFCVLTVAVVQGPIAANAEKPSAVPSDPRSVTHPLNRLGFGPRPGDVERIARTGLGAWIEEQLAPPRGTDGRLAAHLGFAANVTPLPAPPGTGRTPAGSGPARPNINRGGWP